MSGDNDELQAELERIEREHRDIDEAAAEADDAPGPCFREGCRCCTSWTEALQLLRDSIKEHIAGEIRLKPCSSECLVCATVEWQG